MTDSKIISKIKKLQALANSPNVNEAASAAAMAQKLIERHKIELHLLDDIEERPDDHLVTDRLIFTFKGSAVTTWILQLASAVGAANGVKVYYVAGTRVYARDARCPKCQAYYHEPCVDNEGDEVSTCHNARFRGG